MHLKYFVICNNWCLTKQLQVMNEKTNDCKTQQNFYNINVSTLQGHHQVSVRAYLKRSMQVAFTGNEISLLAQYCQNIFLQFCFIQSTNF